MYVCIDRSVDLPIYHRTYVHTYVRTYVHMYVCTYVRMCVSAGSLLNFMDASFFTSSSDAPATAPSPDNISCPSFPVERCLVVSRGIKPPLSGGEPTGLGGWSRNSLVRTSGPAIDPSKLYRASLLRWFCCQDCWPRPGPKNAVLIVLVLLSFSFR